jgi:hypothetical protein
MVPLGDEIWPLSVSMITGPTPLGMVNGPSGAS